jgi:hypothetical protein
MLSASALLAGCGLYVPEMQPFFEPESREKAFENIIVNNVKCELRNAVIETMEMLRTSTPYSGENIDWLLDQGATVALKLSVDEKSSLNPGITFSDPLQNAVKVFPQGGNVTIPRSFTGNLGSANSIDGTRTEIIAFTYSFYDLLHEQGIQPYLGKPCDNEGGVFIQSDLKIRQFILNKVFLAKVPGSVIVHPVGGAPVPVASPFSTFSYEVTFVASFGLNGTPTWNLTTLSANPSSPLFSGSHQRTQDLLITIGKTTRATTKRPAVPSAEAVSLHNAALIGQAVATSIQSQTK